MAHFIQPSSTARLPKLPGAVGRLRAFFKTQRAQEISSRAKMFPLWFFLAYFLFTVVVFAFGPWEIEANNPFTLYSYLALVFGAFAVGYAIRSTMPATTYAFKWEPLSLLKASLIVTAIIVGPAVYYAGDGSFNVLGAILDPGNAYRMAQERSQDAVSGGGSLLGYFVVYASAFTAPIRALALPLTIVLRRRMSRGLFVMCLCVSMSPLLISVMIGTNKAIADMVLVLPWLIWISFHYARRRLTRAHMATAAAVAVVLFAGFLFNLSRNVASRFENSDMSDFYMKLQTKQQLNEGVWAMMPDSVKGALVTAGSYGTQGYNGLAHSLDETDFEWSYGLGNSLFLTSFAEKWAGPGNISGKTYPYRIEPRTGWNARIRWHTIFPWLASDVTFYGVIPLMFLLGRVFAACWLDVLKGENPFALALFCFLLIMLFYIPANNQVMQTFDSFMGFWGCLILWMVSRRHAANRKMGKAS